MYRWLSREFTTVEIVANHLAYTHLYMFLVAGDTAPETSYGHA